MSAEARPLEREVILLQALRYEGGYPTVETIQKRYDQLDVQRAAQAYLDFIPTMSTQALLDAHPRDYGVSETGGMIVYVEPGEGKSIAIGLTYNTESVYASLSLDLKQTGPTVIEVPPKVLGIINGGFMRYVADLGNAGLDRGQGGKYVLLPPGYEGDGQLRAYCHCCSRFGNRGIISFWN